MVLHVVYLYIYVEIIDMSRLYDQQLSFMDLFCILMVPCGKLYLILSVVIDAVGWVS